MRWVSRSKLCVNCHGPEHDDRGAVAKNTPLPAQAVADGHLADLIQMNGGINSKFNIFLKSTENDIAPGQYSFQISICGEAGIWMRAHIRLSITVPPRTDGGLAKVCRASRRRGWLEISAVWCFLLRLCVLACIGASTAGSGVLSSLLSTIPTAWWSTPHLRQCSGDSWM